MAKPGYQQKIHRMNKELILLLPLAILLTSCGEGGKKGDTELIKLSDKDRDEIMTTFLETQDAWNEGSIEGFMKAYWQSEKLVFLGAAGPTYGYTKTLERYKKSYPDRETMGILKFKVIDLYKIDNNSAIMIGQYYLSRSMGDALGYYTLVWQEIEGEWLIVSDHSSGQVIKE